MDVLLRWSSAFGEEVPASRLSEVQSESQADLHQSPAQWDSRNSRPGRPRSQMEPHLPQGLSVPKG